MDRPISPGKDPDSRDAEVKRLTRNGAQRESSCSHCRRIARYATALGVALNLPDATLVGLHRASALHGPGAITAITAITPAPFEAGDGEGSPATPAWQGIPLVLQIVSLVDRFDTLTMEGPDRRSCSVEAACQILLNEATRGRRSMELVKEFVELARSRRLAHLRHDRGAN